MRLAVGGGAIVDKRVVRPVGGLRRKFGEQPRVGRSIGVGLRFAGDRLTEEVERKAAMVAALGEGGLRRLGGIGAGDEAAGLREHGGPHRASGERREDAGAGGLERQADRGRQAVDGGVVDVFAKVTIDGGRVVEHRHAIDEPEEADLEIVVGGGPLASLLGPVVGGDDRRPGVEGSGEQVTADRLHAGLDPIVIGGREPGGEERSGPLDPVDHGRRGHRFHCDFPVAQGFNLWHSRPSAISAKCTGGSAASLSGQGV